MVLSCELLRSVKGVRTTHLLPEQLRIRNLHFGRFDLRKLAHG
jgi:hypothetical protein